MYVSLSTIPKKFPNVSTTIDSLLNQTMLPTAILLHISKKYSFRCGDTTIPEADIAALRNKYHGTLVHINILENDYGPGTKLLGALESGLVPRDARIIIVDDDVVYLPTFLEKLSAGNHLVAANVGYKMKNIMVGEGFGGFLMNINVLDGFINFYEQIKTLDYVNYHDDIYISFYFHIRNIPIHFTGTGWGTFDVNTVNKNIDQLHQIVGKYSRQNLQTVVINILNKHFLNIYIPGPPPSTKYRKGFVMRKK